MTEVKNRLQDYDNLDVFDKEVVMRVLNKLMPKIVSDDAMKRIERAPTEGITYPHKAVRGFMDNMLMNYATQQPQAMAQWFIELRQHIVEILYEQEGEDLEEEIEEEMKMTKWKSGEEEEEEKEQQQQKEQQRK